MHSYLVAIASYEYAQNPAKVFPNRKAIYSRTAPALHSYILQSYNIAIAMLYMCNNIAKHIIL